MLFKRLVIIGPGLIGGSLGLAARKAGLAGHVVGVGHRQSSIDRALEMGAIDSGTLDPAKGVEGADAVVICTAVGMIGGMVRQIAAKLKPGCIVSDVGSTKAGIVKEAESILPKGVHFVGAHPIAGSERRGIETAREDLFRGRVVVLTPSERTDGGALMKMKELWSATGSKVVTVSPAQHDAVLARVSHLPHAVAAALLLTPAQGDGPFVGSGFRDTTRIGGGDADLWVDIFLANREEMLSALGKFEGKLEELKRAVSAKDAKGLKELLERAKTRRENEFTSPD